jgi:predicted nucleotidyltransferase
VTDLPALLRALADSDVRFIVIGGMAGIAHGAARVTFDIDCVYARDAQNLSRLAATLRQFSPSLRGAPAGLPFRLDEATLRSGLNFTLDSTAGPIDLLGEVAGGGTYEALLPSTAELEVFGRPCRVVTLDALIALKRAAGRPKDLEAIAELEALRQAHRGRRHPSL